MRIGLILLFIHLSSWAEPNIEYDVVGGVSLKLDYYPSQNSKYKPGKAILLIHGGCYTKDWGKKEDTTDDARFLAANGFSVFAVEYRMLPEYHYPAAVNDVQMALRWVRKNHLKYNIDPKQIVAIGDSAGGTLAAKLGVQESPDRNGKSDEYSARVFAVVDFYGRHDFMEVPKGEDCPAKFIGLDRKTNPKIFEEAGVIKHIDEKSAQFLIFHGTEDQQVNLQQSIDLQEELTADGIPNELQFMPGQGHGFDDRSSREAWDQVLKFLNRIFTP